MTRYSKAVHLVAAYVMCKQEDACPEPNAFAFEEPEDAYARAARDLARATREVLATMSPEVLEITLGILPEDLELYWGETTSYARIARALSAARLLAGAP